MSLLHDGVRSDDERPERRSDDSYTRFAEGFEFPPEQYAVLQQARRLAWWTIAYLLTVVILMYLVMGSSQAMKTAWLEDMLSLVPPTVFLFASYAAMWKPNRRHPYGYHRAVSIAFLVAATALFAMGGWLLLASIQKLIAAEHPSVGSVTFFGT
ncbi:MAG: cation transporter, partial [Planctomycetaceae bacterium]